MGAVELAQNSLFELKRNFEEKKVKILKNLVIKLDTNEILRLLQSKNSEDNIRKAPQALVDDIKRMTDEALLLIQSRAIYDSFESKELEPKFLFNKSEITVFAICTIGKKLETHTREHLQKGELAKGVILNAIASHAAEQTAEHVNQTILNELSMEIQGKDTTCRFSPGYCQWELGKGQKTIFELLDSSKIGVSLTSSMMMNPVKSVSFAINIGKEVDKELGLRDCENCDMFNCAYRRI